MTHTQWEHGETLTVHNATKEQLKFMVQDEQSRSHRLFGELQKEKEEHEKIFNSFINLVHYISDYCGLETLKTALEYKGKKTI